MLLDRYTYALYHALYMRVATANSTSTLPAWDRYRVVAARATTCDVAAWDTSKHAHQQNMPQHNTCLVSVNRSAVGIFLWFVVEVLCRLLVNYTDHTVNVINLLASILLPIGAAS